LRSAPFYCFRARSTPPTAGTPSSTTTHINGAMGVWRLPSDSVRPFALRLRPSLMRGVRVGSLFNHSASPNVSFSVDSATDSIRYSTTREIAEGEELCIFYGHQLWFEDVDVSEAATPTSDDVFAVVDDGLPGLILEDEGPGHPDACLSNSQALWTNLTAVYRSGDADEVVATENLPFERVQTLPEDPEEETMDAVQTSTFNETSRVMFPPDVVQCRLGRWISSIPGRPALYLSECSTPSHACFTNLWTTDGHNSAYSQPTTRSRT
jgi:hypothetical protein